MNASCCSRHFYVGLVLHRIVQAQEALNDTSAEEINTHAVSAATIVIFNHLLNSIVSIFTSANSDRIL